MVRKLDPHRITWMNTETNDLCEIEISLWVHSINNFVDSYKPSAVDWVWTVIFFRNEIETYQASQENVHLLNVLTDLSMVVPEIKSITTYTTYQERIEPYVGKCYSVKKLFEKAYDKDLRAKVAQQLYHTVHWNTYTDNTGKPYFR